MDDHTFTVEKDEVGLGYCVFVQWQDGRRDAFGDKIKPSNASGSMLPDGCSTPRRRLNKMKKPDKFERTKLFRKSASSTQATSGIRRLVEQALSKKDSR